MNVWFSERLYLCGCCFLFRGSIRSRKDSRSNYILYYVRPCHIRPYGDCLFSLKIYFLMQKLHKPVVKQNILSSDFVCYSVRYDFQHNNGILTICIPSPTAWPCSEFMARADSKLPSGHFSIFTDAVIRRMLFFYCTLLLYPTGQQGRTSGLFTYRKAFVLFHWKRDCFF